MKTDFYNNASSSCRQLRCRGAWQRISLALLLMMLTSLSSWADEITYIDAKGDEVTCTNATKITSASDDASYGTDNGDDLWYYVDGSVEISGSLLFSDGSGSTNIILCDGASL